MRPRVLLVTERWKTGQPGPLTNNAHNLWGSMEASGLVDGSVFCFDEYHHRHGRNCDEKLIEMAGRFDLVLVCLLPQGFPTNPKPTTLEQVAAQTRLALLWPDAALSHHERVARHLEPFTVRSILWDVDFDWFADSKFLHLWTPQDPRLFFDAGLERDIDVSFVGSVVYPERRLMLSQLQVRGIDVHVCGGRHGDDSFSPQAYAQVMQRSKISLNFCGTPFGREQLKGRVFEVTSCGAMLMESMGRENWAERWFVPGRDYVRFDGLDDLSEKIITYLDDDQERERIAGNGHRRATETYSARAWWAYLLEECGVWGEYVPPGGVRPVEKFIVPTEPQLPYRRLGRRRQDSSV